MRLDLLHIGDQIGVRQHDAFRRTFRSRCEEEHARFIRRKRMARMDHAGDDTAHHAHRFVERCQRRANVFEIDDTHLSSCRARLCQDGVQRLVEAGLIDETARCDERLDFANLQGGDEIAYTGRKIQKRRHAAIGGETEQGDDGRIHIRQHHANRFASHGLRLKSLAKYERAKDEAAISERCTLLIFQNGCLCAKGFGCSQKRAEQRIAGFCQCEWNGGWPFIYVFGRRR